MKKAVLPLILIALTTIIVSTMVIHYLSHQEIEDTTEPEISKAPEVEVMEEKGSLQASFTIITEGTTRTFTNTMYHNQSEDVYITSDNPNIITVTKPETTWQQFFDTLPFEVTKDCLTTGLGETFCSNQYQTLSFYLNGVSLPDALDQVIGDGDKLLINFGSESEDTLQQEAQELPHPNGS